MSIQTSIARVAGEIQAQTGLIAQLNEGLAAAEENYSKTVTEINNQSTIIQQIKTALEGKAGGGGGTVLPTLTNPGTAEDLVDEKELIGPDGQVIMGKVKEYIDGFYPSGYARVYDAGDILAPVAVLEESVFVRRGAEFSIDVPRSAYGNAKPEDVRAGVTFTSESGWSLPGTGTMGGGYAIKSGTTTSRTINTGLSEIEGFFIYKESQTGTGLIHLHYTKTATSRMYASAWSTQNYGTKTITNGTGGVTVSGGTLTISATQATQGALTSNVTYKWVAIGKE